MADRTSDVYRYRPDPDQYGGYEKEEPLENAELPPDREAHDSDAEPHESARYGGYDKDEELEHSSLSFLEDRFRRAAQTAPPVRDGTQKSWIDEIDRGARAAIDTFGWAAVRDYIHLIYIENHTKRSVGKQCFDDTDSTPSEVWGIIIGDAAEHYMRGLIGEPGAAKQLEPIKGPETDAVELIEASEDSDSDDEKKSYPDDPQYDEEFDTEAWCEHAVDEPDDDIE
ncbi:hypothetical protein ACFQE1_00190 [Halobium palmae]|uniref:DUF8158 domain-containing protein n=1 Tax=Halobium palmae TaxID=1776492 RepID=A0ABD5RTU3_9EURY